jgi:DNA polymerase-3 subunit gamma/tau
LRFPVVAGSVVVGSLAAVALALYRKYRPAKFSEVVGQEHVTEPLSTALAAGRINHAYLFSGPRGCGKTSSARILARSLNCEQGPTPDPCGVCASCVSLAPGGPGNIDVTELDAASHGGVDDTRELRDRAFFAPAESRYRVFIVDEAHMITTQGFNALLKIVEEPPEHLVFVFATTEPDKVLSTIRSRTHHYPFRLIPPGTLRKLLERICAEEAAVVAPPVYPLVLRAGGGSARDTLSVLDQLLAGAGPEGVTYERAVALLGVTDVALIDDMVDALAAGDRAAVFSTVDRLVEAGHDPRRFAADLLQRLRDIVLLQSVPEAAERGLVEAADDEIARIAEQAGKIGAATLTRYGEIVHTGLTEMRGATAPRLLLELLCARMLLPAATVAEPGLLERLERLERRSAIAPGPPGPEDDGPGESLRTFRRPSVATTAARADEAIGPVGAAAGPPPPAPVPDARPEDDGSRAPRPAPEQARVERPERPGPAQTPAAPPPAAPPPAAQTPAAPPPAARPGAAAQSAPPPPEPASVPPAADPGGELDAPAVRRVWPEILTAARSQSRSIEAMLVNATVRAVEGDILVLGIGAPSLARRLAEQRNADIVAAALHSVLGVRWQIRCESGDTPAPPPTPSRGAPPPRRSGPGDAPRQQAAPPARAQRPPPARRSSAPDDGVPLPPEPPEDDVPPEDEEAMLAEAAVPVGDAQRRDPEEVAIELLTTELGARAIDRR